MPRIKTTIASRLTWFASHDSFTRRRNCQEGRNKLVLLRAAESSLNRPRDLFRPALFRIICSTSGCPACSRSRCFCSNFFLLADPSSRNPDKAPFLRKQEIHRSALLHAEHRLRDRSETFRRRLWRCWHRYWHRRNYRRLRRSHRGLRQLRRSRNLRKRSRPLPRPPQPTRLASPPLARLAARARSLPLFGQIERRQGEIGDALQRDQIALLKSIRMIRK